MYYTHVLRSRVDKKLYTGFTTNLQVRLEAHQKGRIPSTRDRRPLELIYYEACRSQADATRREKYLKTYYGKMFIKKRLKHDSTG